MTDNVINGGQVSPELLTLGSFRREERLWPRRAVDRERVREFEFLYRRSGPEALPPLLVLEVAGQRYLADGWQRCEAAEALDWRSLPAIVQPAARTEDVYLEALEAISEGDRPLALTTVEKRAAVDRLLRLVPRPSDYGIARLAGVSQPFVSARRRWFDAGGAGARAEAAAPTPSRQEGGKLLASAARLAHLEWDMSRTADGRPIDAATALREAARARGDGAVALLEQLEQWVRRARLELASGTTHPTV